MPRGMLFPAHLNAGVPLWRDLKLAAGLMLDPLSSVLVLIVTWIAAHPVYATGYMNFARLRLRALLPDLSEPFAGAMLILVLGDSLPITFIGWEGVEPGELPAHRLLVHRGTKAPPAWGVRDAPTIGDRLPHGYLRDCCTRSSARYMEVLRLSSHFAGAAGAITGWGGRWRTGRLNTLSAACDQKTELLRGSRRDGRSDAGRRRPRRW